jgi:hypothetical protein
MASEIRRNCWTRFCREFSAANQYRPTQLKVAARKGKPETTSLVPFLGVAISKKGRFIDGVQFYAGRAEAEHVAEPVLTIYDPAEIFIDKDKSGVDNCLSIRSKDGKEVCLELTGEQEPSQAQQLVEKIAYSLYERRGYSNGYETDDWLQAERIVRDAESYLTG